VRGRPEARPTLVHFAVVVGVFQDNHVAGLFQFALAVDVRHEAAHLEDPKAAVRIERDLNQVVHERFAGDKFETEAGLEFERFERLLGGTTGAGGINSFGTGGAWVSACLSPCCAHTVSPAQSASKRIPNGIGTEGTLLTGVQTTCQAVSVAWTAAALCRFFDRGPAGRI
jgi:hypothetical protein